MEILQFSGGKDSLACLLLNRHRLDDITVMWADSGDSFPETYRLMDKVSSMCKNFVVVKGNQPKVIEQYGYPVDVLPVRNHCAHKYLAQQDRPSMQTFLECCSRSILIPMHEKCIELGAKKIIRGQKNKDGHKSPVKNGDIIDGIEYSFPIEDWSDNQVYDYVKDSDLFSDHYKTANTSMDCMHCTAYIADNKWKLEYLKTNYPDVAKTVSNRLCNIIKEIKSDISHIEELGVLYA